jgi:hypothetical protein
MGMACDAFWIEECTCLFERADFLKCYIDDILVHNKGLLQHLAHLEELFKRFHEVNMKIHPKKCEFVVTSIVYFGHRILLNGIMAHWAKVIAILEMPNPTNVHTLKSFIGLCNYYKIYVQDFSIIIHPLYALLKNMLLGYGVKRLKKLSTH